MILSGAVSSGDAKELYLDLLKRVLVNYIYQDPNVSPRKPQIFDAALRAQGRDWPRDAHTMVGLKRLDNLQACIEKIIAEKVPGDLIETGVWRGGSAIFMRAVLAAFGDRVRKVWVADSFEGLPEPDEKRFPADKGDKHHEVSFLAVSAREVKSNFERYGLLDDQVRFLEGWFADTLPSAPIDQLSLLRLDGDMYGSTWDAITNLYPKVSPGGFIIVDDYGAVEGCRRAIDDYRFNNKITAQIEEIDWTAVYWRKA